MEKYFVFSKSPKNTSVVFTTNDLDAARKAIYNNCEFWSREHDNHCTFEIKDNFKRIEVVEYNSGTLGTFDSVL